MIKFPTLKRTLSPSFRGALFYLSFFLSMGSFSPFLNVYYQEMGFSGKQIGVLSIFFPLMTLLLSTALSALADRKNWRIQILQAAIVGAGIFIFLLKFPGKYGEVAAILVAMAICFSPMMSIADSLIVNMAKNRGLNYGSMRLWGSVGFAVSATTLGQVYQRSGFLPMFAISSLLLIPVFIIAGTLETNSETRLVKSQPIGLIFKDLGLVSLIITSFLMGISNALSLSFEGIYVQYLGGGNGLVGAMVGVSGVGEILTMQFGQNIAQRLKNTNTLILSLGLMGCAYVGYVTARNPIALIPMASLKGLGFGLFFTNIVSMVNERAPVEWVTTAQSLRAVAMFGVAPLLASPLGGVIHDEISPAAIFVLACGSSALAMLLVSFARRKGHLVN